MAYKYVPSLYCCQVAPGNLQIPGVAERPSWHCSNLPTSLPMWPGSDIIIGKNSMLNLASTIVFAEIPECRPDVSTSGSHGQWCSHITAHRLVLPLFQSKFTSQLIDSRAVGPGGGRPPPPLETSGNLLHYYQCAYCFVQWHNCVLCQLVEKENYVRCGLVFFQINISTWSYIYINHV